MGWIRIGALGDLLVGLASLREALEKWPSAKVTVVGTPLWKEIIEPGYWPQIDRLALVEKRGSVAQIFEICEGQWAKSGERTLRTEFRGYRAVFNTRVDSPRQGFPAFWAGVPERWGAAEGLGRFIYNRRGTHHGKDPLIHERDVPLLLMDEAEGVVSAGTLADQITASPRIQKWRGAGLPCPRALDKSVALRLVGEEPYFVVNPTSSRREKAWPSAKFAELLRSDFMRDLRVRPVVVGAPSETNWLREVAGDDFEVIQPSDIQQLFQVVAGAKFIIANTSSVQFIAAATQTPCLTLIGRARPEIWGPVGPQDIWVRGVEPSDEFDLFKREERAYASIEVSQVIDRLRTPPHNKLSPVD